MEDFETTVEGCRARLNKLIQEFEKEMFMLGPYKRHVNFNLKTFTGEEFQKHQELLDKVCTYTIVLILFSFYFVFDTVITLCFRTLKITIWVKNRGVRKQRVSENYVLSVSKK